LKKEMVQSTSALDKEPVELQGKSTVLQRKVLSVRLDEDQTETPISHFHVRESQFSFSIEGSGISFADLFHLVAFYCVSR
ncbi:hypothetical protein GOODEAATRI_002128, partial [Goodea atripinnis]